MPRVGGEGVIVKDCQSIFGAVVDGDTEGGIVVAGPVENAVGLVTVRPQRTGTMLRVRVTVAAGEFGGDSQAGEAGTVKRHEAKIAAHFDGGEGAGGKIVEGQNSDGRIAQECFGEADLDGGSEVADAEPAGGVVEAMNGRLSSGRAEPERISAVGVNSHPARAGSHDA